MKTCIVMPAFNEQSGIKEFLDELSLACKRYNPDFFIVDDKSTDGMNEILVNLSQQNEHIHVVRNEKNLGHGPSTVKALWLGLESGSDVIVAVDGDGQFLGRDILKALDLLQSAECDIVEGVRRHRHDPIYRQFVSGVTRLFVFLRCGKVPKDANTPLRVYRRSALQPLLRELSIYATVPNLLISTRARNSNLDIFEFSVTSISRRGEDITSVTWKNRVSFLPSVKFLKFIAVATKTFWSRS